MYNSDRHPGKGTSSDADVVAADEILEYHGILAHMVTVSHVPPLDYTMHQQKFLVPDISYLISLPSSIILEEDRGLMETCRF